MIAGLGIETSAFRHYDQPCLVIVCYVMSDVPLTYLMDANRHLICLPYSVENLHKMADDLGIKRGWYHRSKYPHYDIPLKMLDAISQKCQLVSSREILTVIKDYQRDHRL